MNYAVLIILSLLSAIPFKHQLSNQLQNVLFDTQYETLTSHYHEGYAELLEPTNKGKDESMSHRASNNRNDGGEECTNDRDSLNCNGTNETIMTYQHHPNQNDARFEMDDENPSDHDTMVMELEEMMKRILESLTIFRRSMESIGRRGLRIDFIFYNFEAFNSMCIYMLMEFLRCALYLILPTMMGIFLLTIVNYMLRVSVMLIQKILKFIAHLFYWYFMIPFLITLLLIIGIGIILLLT